MEFSLSIELIRHQVKSQTEFGRGYSLFENGFVWDIEKEDESVIADVRDNRIESVDLCFKEGELSEYSCSCETFNLCEGACRHVVAVLFAIMKFSENETKPKAYQPVLFLEDFIKKQSTVGKGDVGITVVLLPETYKMHKMYGVEIKIGTERDYVVKDVLDFANAVNQKREVKYGRKLSFIHDVNAFLESDRKLLVFILDACKQFELFKEFWGKNSDMESERTLYLSPTQMKELFMLESSKKIEIDGKYYDVENGNLPKIFEAKRSGDAVLFRILHKKVELFGDLCLIDKKAYLADRDVGDSLKTVLTAFEEKNTREIELSGNEEEQFCNFVIPRLYEWKVIECDEELLPKIKTPKLKIYIDLKKKDVVLKPQFCYDNYEINPLAPNGENVLRNFEFENQALQKIVDLGFFEKGDSFVIQNENEILDFILSGVNKLSEFSEIYHSEAFKKVKIRKSEGFSTPVSIVENGLIEIDLKTIPISPSQLVDVLTAIKFKKKYFRLNDGSFLDLDIPFFNNLSHLNDALGITNSEIRKGKLQIPMYRAPLVLDAGVKFKLDGKIEEVVARIKNFDAEKIEHPENLNAKLRGYQLTALKWLSMISKNNFSGILADDMGLGKTLEIISLFACEHGKHALPSLVVVPASLIYNWQSEIVKFAPTLNAKIIVGNIKEREKLIKENDDCDVYITSYDLVKRDMEAYSTKEFEYLVIDEAQAIKNHSTQNARSVKKINAKHKFALTGTPIENNLSELWSIFDFLMPGILGSHKHFKQRYELPIVKEKNEERKAELLKQISPFILRRLKKDVLPELPDKIESTMVAPMTDEQSMVYAASAMQANKDFANILEAKGLGRGKIEILALITRLRQICCHPSLAINDYTGGSGKLDLCMELVEQSLASGHRILLFSQFISMLSIVKNELDKLGIKYFYLDGKTPKEDRLKMVNAFNSGENAMFLISLKAGGTGLNLTGADVVIHFDPWWNPAVMNQATDRAHRIGQKNKVQVYKLLAQNSIEEKIDNLQKKKANLVDEIIKPGEVFLSKLSEDEIRELF